MSSLSEVDGSDLGIIFDGSHQSGTFLDIRIVEFAIGFGFPIDKNEWQDAMKEWELREHLGEWEFIDLCEAITEECSRAIEWMNDQVPENYYFFIDDNSLYLTYEEAGYHE